jgi:hypothetical protein
VEVGKPSLAKKQMLKLKQRCRAWQKTDAATEGCETYNLEAFLQLLIKEFKMPVLSQQNNESTVIAENTDVSLNWDTGNKTRGGTIALALQNIYSLPSVRKKKILKVRQQLVKGRYDLNERLNVALDRLLEELVA